MDLRLDIPGGLRPLVLAAALALPTVAAAQAAIAPRTVTAGDAGAAAGAGQITPALFSGSASYAVKIEVPRGRGDMQPDAFLSYRSNGANSWVGVGWSLELGSIQRSTRNGLNFSGDAFVLVDPEGSQDLIAAQRTSGTAPSDFEYREKIEGAFKRIVRRTAADGQPYFEVTDTRGVKYRYGATAASRQDDPSASTRIFKWCLDQIVDPDGNYTSFAYLKDHGEIYPDSMSFVGHSDGTLPTGSLKFYLESRPDSHVSYATGFSTQQLYRLKTIDVLASGNRVRAYTLQYATSLPTSQRSTLASVQQFGSDAVINAVGQVSSGTSLPATTLLYSDGQLPSTTATTGPSRWVGHAINDVGNDVSRIRYGDFNGDGRMDIAAVEGANSSQPISIYLATSTGFAAAIPGPTRYVGSGNWTGPDISRVSVGDFDGDGKADFIAVEGANSSGPMSLYLAKDGYAKSTWNTPVLQVVGTNPSDVSDMTSRVIYADFNGDGRTDILVAQGGANAPLLLYLSTGTGFAAPIQGPTTSVSTGDWTRLAMSRIKVGDFNGDGKLDLAVVDGWGGAPSPIKIYLFDGQQFDLAHPLLGPSVYVQAEKNWGQVDCQRVMVGDFNGDGLADFLIFGDLTSTYSIDGTRNSAVYLSTGSSFVYGFAGPTIPNSHYIQGIRNRLSSVRLGDFNGDGQLDVAVLNATASYTPVSIYLSTGGAFQAARNGPSRFINTDDNWAAVDIARVIQGDFNGDGKTDLAGVEGSLGGSGSAGYANMSIYLTPPAPTDKLVSVGNGLGGTLGVTYTSSANFSNTRLPFPVVVLSSVTASDGRNHSATTTYGYSGGYFEPSSKEFRGFAYVSALGPKGPSGEQLLQETWFHQGDDLGLTNSNPGAPVGITAGRPYLEKSTSLTDGSYRSKETTYAYDAVHASNSAAPYFNPRQSLVTRSGSAVGQAAVAERVSTEQYAYDPYGNLVRVDHLGDPATAADDTTTTVTFAYNVNSWMVSYKLSEKVYDGTFPGVATASLPSASLLSQVDSYYDGTVDGGCLASGSSTLPSRGHVSRTVRWLNGGTSPIVDVGYDVYGNVACVRDPRGSVTWFAYDGSKTLQRSTTNALGQVVQTEYYGVDGTSVANGVYGKPYRVIGADGNRRLWKYDPLGRTIQETLPDQGVRSWSYVLTGAPVSDSQYTQLTDQVGGRTLVYLDGLGREYLRKVTHAAAGRAIASTTAYNPTGTVAATSLAYYDGVESAQLVAKVYDSWGREVRATTPDGRVALTCYDDGHGVTETITGIKSSSSSPRGNLKRLEHDADGRIAATKEYSGTYATCWTEPATPYAVTTYQYDHFGRVTEVTDANGAVIQSFGYDTLGRRRFRSTADSGTWYFDYDAAGNLSKQTDAKQQQTLFGYDALNRVTTRTSPSGQITAFGYDAPAVANGVGRLTSVQDAAGSSAYAYDTMGRQASESRRHAVDNSTATVGWSFDPAGRLTTVVYQADAMPVASAVYGYDGDGNLGSVTDGTVTASFSDYTSDGHAKTITYGNGVVSRFTYDPAARTLSSASAVRGGNVLLSQVYGYDDAGRVATVSDSVTPALSASYGYDEFGRLTSASSTMWGALSYLYDTTGNIVRKEGVVYAYDPLKVHAVTSTSDGHAYQYDANGNVLSDGTRTMTYDVDDQLSSVTSGGQTVRYGYDSTGQRRSKVTAAGVTTYMGRWLQCATDGSGQTCTRNVFAGPVLIASAGGRSGPEYFHQDQVGSVRLVTDANGGVLETVAYKPFGEVSGDTNPAASDYKFGTHRTDAESGLVYMGARYYDPHLARFLEPDSHPGELANPQGFNAYSYAFNDPVNFMDPMGRWPARFWKFAGAVTIFVATVAADVVCTYVCQAAVPYLTSAAIGEASAGLAGGYSGYQASGGNWNNVANGALMGAAVGGVTGALAAWAAPGQGILQGAIYGGIDGLGQGFASGYQGGLGDKRSMFGETLIGGIVGAVAGGVIGGLDPASEAAKPPIKIAGDPPGNVGMASMLNNPNPAGWAAPANTLDLGKALQLARSQPGFNAFVYSLAQQMVVRDSLVSLAAGGATGYVEKEGFLRGTSFDIPKIDLGSLDICKTFGIPGCR